MRPWIRLLFALLSIAGIGLTFDSLAAAQQPVADIAPQAWTIGESWLRDHKAWLLGVAAMLATWSMLRRQA